MKKVTTEKRQKKNIKYALRKRYEVYTRDNREGCIDGQWTYGVL